MCACTWVCARVDLDVCVHGCAKGWGCTSVCIEVVLGKDGLAGVCMHVGVCEGRFRCVCARLCKGVGVHRCV